MYSTVCMGMSGGSSNQTDIHCAIFAKSKSCTKFRQVLFISRSRQNIIPHIRNEDLPNTPEHNENLFFV